MGSSLKRSRRHSANNAASLAEVRAEINVTPLVDVSLVLLLIFMVVSLKISRGMDVQLPETLVEEKEQQADDMQPIVSILENKEVCLEKKCEFGKVTKKEALYDLLDALKKSWREGDEDVRQKLTIKVHHRVRMRDVRPLIVLLHDDGVVDLNFGTYALEGK